MTPTVWTLSNEEIDTFGLIYGNWHTHAFNTKCHSQSSLTWPLYGSAAVTLQVYLPRPPPPGQGPGRHSAGPAHTPGSLPPPEGQAECQVEQIWWC